MIWSIKLTLLIKCVIRPNFLCKFNVFKQHCLDSQTYFQKNVNYHGYFFTVFGKHPKPGLENMENMLNCSARQIGRFCVKKIIISVTIWRLSSFWSRKISSMYSGRQPHWSMILFAKFSCRHVYSKTYYNKGYCFSE